MIDWLRPDEAAAWLNVTTGRAHRLAHRYHWRKTGPHNDRRYHADDVEALVTSACREHQTRTRGYNGTHTVDPVHPRPTH